MPILGTKYKRSNIIFLVTDFALICARVCTQLLQPFVQSLIGSPGTIPEPLEKEIHEILGSKCEERFYNPFFELVQNTTFVRFWYLLCLCKFCQAPPGVEGTPFMYTTSDRFDTWLILSERPGLDNITSQPTMV